MAETPLTRLSLLVRIREAQDQEAWQQLVSIYGPVVYGYARKRGLQEADAEDLTQEVLRGVAAAAPKLEAISRQGSFRKWLFTLAHHRLYDWLHAKKRQAQGSGDTGMHELLQQQPATEDSSAWDQEYEQRLFNWAAEQVRPHFADTTWQAFVLTAVEGQAAKEVAQRLGLSIAAVYLGKSRVMARLREQIQTVEGEEAVAPSEEMRLRSTARRTRHMPQTILCPDPLALKALLDCTLPEVAQEEIGSHLENCSSCQQTLETLAAGATFWSAAPRHLGRAHGAHEPALQRALGKLQMDAPDPSTLGDAGPSLAPVLDFLAPAEQPGALGRLGHYEVLEVLGHGAMGVVLKAIDGNLNRVVAIKVLAAHLASSATARKRFVREAHAAAAVRDEHVVGIYGVEDAQGLPYLVMEYVDGMSLQERLDQGGPLELEPILNIGWQTAAALAAAHGQGLIHRDIKPANILLEGIRVERSGIRPMEPGPLALACVDSASPPAPSSRAAFQVKITDFGLARAVEDAILTQNGVVAGTPAYMAPEQARGTASDQRADLFSLGSVLYVMCTGRQPFRAQSTLAVLNCVCDEAPPPIEEPATPDWLVAIIAKLHAKDPAERFQSAAEVAALLRKHLAHVQDPAGTPAPAAIKRTAARPPKAAPRRLGWLVAASLLALLAGLGLTEATGVTQLLPTVIRIFTPEGTLVVDVEDPSVKVTIEGDATIVITGAGPQEVRLSPGGYKVRATKNGKPVREEELITITRGDKQVVRVRREAPLALSPVEPPTFADTKLKPAPPTPAEAKLLVELKGYDAALKENPKDLAKLHKRGEVLLRLKRFDAAVAAFSQVIMNTSDQAERKWALFNRAVTQAERGHLQGTIEDYEEYLRDGDEAPWVYGRLATCYTFGPEKLRNPKRALEHAESAIKNGAHPGYHTLHGVRLYRQGRQRAALEVLERAYEDKAKNKDGRTAMNRFFAAMTYQSLGEPTKAQECYALALKLPQPTGHPGMIPNWVELMRAEAEVVLKIPAKE